METFVNFMGMVQRFKGSAFIDPGSKAMMSRDRWYLLDHGGSSLCSPYGFKTREACRQTLDRFVGEAFPMVEVNYLPQVTIDGKIDRFLPGAWDRPLLQGSLVHGSDMYRWWASNNAAQLINCNREMLDHG